MRAVGIDLGTTNTVAAEDGSVLEAEAGANTGPFLPSVVAFMPKERRLVGTPARRRLAIDPKNTVASAKRLIGRRWNSSDANLFRKAYAYDLVEGDSGEACFKVRAGVVSPVEVASIVLEAKWRQVDIDPVESAAVITVPSKFGKQERGATEAAARKARLGKFQILDEPIATAWAYLDGTSNTASRAVVYDFGGGTFDMAVLDCTTTTFRVVAHGGDLYLGGDDIDRALADWVAEKVLQEHRWDLRADATVFARLINECEQSTETRSRSSSASLSDEPLSLATRFCTAPASRQRTSMRSSSPAAPPSSLRCEKQWNSTSPKNRAATTIPWK
jgi:molecular chaperone DnaK